MAVGGDPGQVDAHGEDLAAGQDPVQPVAVAVVQRPAEEDRQGDPEVGQLGLGVDQHAVGHRHGEPVGQGQGLVEPVPGADRVGELVLVEVEGDGRVADVTAEEAEEGGQVHHVADQQHVRGAVLGHHPGDVLGQRERRAPQPPAPVGGIVGDQVDLVARVPDQPLGPCPVRPPEVRLHQDDPRHTPILPVQEW